MSATLDNPIIIFVEDGHFAVGQGDRAANDLTWGEMIEQVVKLTTVQGPLYRMLTAEERAAERERGTARAAEMEERRSQRVDVALDVEEARHIASCLADLLAWASGFKAAIPDGDSSRAPPGIFGVETIRNALILSIARTTQQ